MLPTFLIVGAMKCGTTSLYHYLAEHPEISMSRVKETNFFIVERNHSRGLEWYESLFAGPAKACGEASPNYSKHWLFRGVPERIHAVLPQARLIYLVRDPIDRMISHYKHRLAQGTEKRPLREALTDRQRNPYLLSSRYYESIAPFLRYYLRENILILTSEQLRHERQATLSRVFEFLNVNPAFIGPGAAKVWHRSDKKLAKRQGRLGRLLNSRWLRIMNPRHWQVAGPAALPEKCDHDLQNQLIERLRPDIDRFRQWTGGQYPEWSL